MIELSTKTAKFSVHPITNLMTYDATDFSGHYNPRTRQLTYYYKAKDGSFVSDCVSPSQFKTLTDKTRALVTVAVYKYFKDLHFKKFATATCSLKKIYPTVCSYSTSFRSGPHMARWEWGNLSVVWFDKILIFNLEDNWKLIDDCDGNFSSVNSLLNQWLVQTELTNHPDIAPFFIQPEPEVEEKPLTKGSKKKGLVTTPDLEEDDDDVEEESDDYDDEEDDE